MDDNHLNPFHTYKINSNCELADFFINGPGTGTLRDQNLTKKYPEEMEKIVDAIETPQFMEYLTTYPRDGTKMPSEMKDAMASITIKEYSINPKLRQSVIDVIGYGPQAWVYKIAKDEPDCPQKMQAKQDAIKQEQEKKLQAPWVFRIVSITAGSAAQKAGLLPGDIITAINGTKITHLADWTKIKLYPGKVVIVTISRNGQTLEIPVVPDVSRDDPTKGMLGVLRTS